MRADRRVAILVVALVALFAPLSYSDLPDQTWLGGLWDGGDNDDIILQLESTGCTVEALALYWSEPVLVVIGSTVIPPEPAVVSVSASADSTRAPPTL